MATRSNRRFDIARVGARERRRRQNLSRCRDRVAITGEEKQRAVELTQVDAAAERAEPARGDTVLAKNPFADFKEIGTRKIERPPLPALEGLDRLSVVFVYGRSRELKRVDDKRGFVVMRRGFEVSLRFHASCAVVVGGV
jgi:hypothetical protein